MSRFVVGTRNVRRQDARSVNPSRAARLAVIETVEARVLFAVDPVISEFMAANGNTLADIDGEYSDWIEIRNPNAAPFDLTGWHLTDDASVAGRTKWTFPATTINPNGYLVVFASDKDLAVAGQQLHTNFKLTADGEYLALTRPDGTAASAFAPSFPAQTDDVSYGLPAPSAATTTLIGPGAPLRVAVPANGNLGTTWTSPTFNDAGWTPGSSGVGYEASGGPPNLPNEAEPNDATATANDAAANFAAYAGNAYHMGLKGAVSTSGEFDFFSIGTLQVGDVVTLSLAGTSAGRGSIGDGYVELWRATGSSQLTGNDDGGPGADALVHRYTIAAVDTYYVKARGYSSNTGTYDLGVWLENAGAAPSTGGTLAAESEPNGTPATANDSSASWRAPQYRSVTGGAITTGNVDYYKYQFTAGDLVTVNVDSTSALDARVTMYSAAGAVVAREDGGSDRAAPYNLDSTLYAYAIPTSGAYYVKVEGGGTGAYGAEVYLSTASPPPAAASYTGLINTNVQPQMQGVNASALVRVPFNCDASNAVSALTLGMKYDDGFVAYLNGTEVARRNAGGTAGTPLDYAAAAASDRANAQAAAFEYIDLTAHKDLLVNGGNVLAIQGLNRAANDTDFLLVPDLRATGTPAQPPPAYFPTPTPGAVNGAAGLNDGPTIFAVSAPPPAPLDADDIGVTASVAPRGAPVGAVTLKYRVMYGNEASLAMSDDGAHGDGAAGDGVYGATIPASASAPGEMVRWYVTAADTAGRSSRAPINAVVESPAYFGTVVRDAVTSPLTILRLFAESTSAMTTRTGSRGSVYFGGEFHDNVFIRDRGGASSDGIKVDFNRGDHFRWSATSKLVDEINLNYASSYDGTNLRAILSFDTFRDAGEPTLQASPWRVQVNNAFWKEATFIENPDGDHLGRVGLDPEGALYKVASDTTSMSSAASGAFEKKTREGEDRSDLQAFLDGIHLTGQAQTNYLLDHFDVMGFLNYWAVNQVVNDNDDARKNFFLYRDTNGDGRWRMLAWDKDLTFGKHYGIGDYHAVDPQTHPLFGSAGRGKIDGAANFLLNLLLGNATIRHMYLRRLRSVMDQFLQPESTPLADRYFENKIDAYYNLMSADPQVVAQLGGSVSAFQARVNDIKTRYLSARRQHLYVDHSANTAYPDFAGIPAAQAGAPQVNIGAYDSFPANGDQGAEYVRLDNPSSAAVDVSGWKLADAVDFTLAPGTVVPASGSLYVAADIPSFKARTTGPSGNQGLFVVGGYDGQLSARGETILLTNAAGATVHSVAYTGAPTAAQQGLRVTEIMYHPADAPGNVPPDDDFEFIELHNISIQTLNLAGVKFTQGFDLTLGDVSLAPGGYGVVVRNTAAFRSRYGTGAAILGTYGPTDVLDNGGERVRIEDPSGEVVLDFNYDPAWQPATDGVAGSLVIVDPLAPVGTWGDAAAWRTSTFAGGSPGLADPAGSRPFVVAVRVNDGQAQRSRVTSLEVAFDHPVAVEAGAFELVRRGGAGVAVTATPSVDGAAYTLTFGGAGATAGSLDDGIYDLRVVGAKVHAGTLAGPAMAADHTSAFHRLFSDVDGDGDSDNADLFQMRSTYSTFSSNPAYKWYFDSDGDGDVDNADVFQVRSRRTITFQGY